MTEGWKGAVSTLIFSTALALGGSALAQDRTITIPIDEYEELKEAVEGAKDNQYWKMTFEQILEEENNNVEDAWEIYEYWVLRTVHVDGAIRQSTVVDLTSKVETLNRIGDEPITMVINSPGGAVFAGFNLINMMENSEAPIHTVCDGVALSMAAVAVAAGDYRVASSGCTFMIHEVAVGAPGGQTTDHVKWTDAVIDIEEELVRMLSNYSGLSKPEVRTLTEYETFWNAEEATRLGFFDEFEETERDVAERSIPKDLLPENRIKQNIEDKLNTSN